MTCIVCSLLRWREKMVGKSDFVVYIHAGMRRQRNWNDRRYCSWGSRGMRASPCGWTWSTASLLPTKYTPLYTENRLVVLTTEWLPWLHGTSEASCREVVSLSFPPLFLIPEWETTKKLVVLYSSLYYHSKPCNHGNHLLLKQLYLFLQWHIATAFLFHNITCYSLL